MSKNKALKEHIFLKEELHRGKWQPLKGDSGVQLFALITEEQAEIMNQNAVAKKVRFVKGERPAPAKKDVKEVEVKDAKTVGPSPDQKVDLSTLGVGDLRKIYKKHHPDGKGASPKLKKDELISKINEFTNS